MRRALAIAAVSSCLATAVIAAALARPQATPTTRAPVSAPACTVCMLQRDGDLAHIARHTAGLPQPPDSGGFGHCATCVYCEGDARATCAGWWSVDPDSAGIWPEAGAMRDDTSTRWQTAACYFATAAEGAGIRQLTAAYPATQRYQVLDRGGRSCLSYCADAAATLDVGVSWPRGALTLPGELEFDDPEVARINELDEDPERFMYGVHPAWAELLRRPAE